MGKFLLIGSVAAVLYGDCAWGMDDIDPWAGVPSNLQESVSASNSDQFRAESARESASPTARSRRNSRQFNAEPTRENAGVSYQAAPTQTDQVQANSQQSEENRFIKIEFEGDRGYNGALTGAVLNNTYQQYHYDLSNNSKMGRATPTTVVTVTRDDLRGWNDIAEIRYANDVSYDKLENPKVILYRNRDNSCYIILRIEENKHGVFYGTNERSIEVGRSSFAVYDLSEDVGSFTDSVARLIYVDESGLYFVPKEENSVENVTDTYQKEGKFKFEGSVIKVSAVDGTITLNGKPVTKDNFFDNWVLEESGTEKQVSTGTVRFGANNTNTGFGANANTTAPTFSGFGTNANTTAPTFSGFGTNNTSVKAPVLSTKQPGEKEILRNFYPPEGNYRGIYWTKHQSNGNTSTGWLNAYGRSIHGGEIVNLFDKIWLNSFINKRVSIVKSKNKIGAAELVRDGTFSSILATYNDKIWDGSKRKYVNNPDGYNQAVRDAIATQIAVAKGKTVYGKTTPLPIPEMVKYNSNLFRDPEFVKSLKPAFAEIEKDYEHNKESEMWIPFEIVKNL
ncbi:MAG: nucleoporin [Alphaproteobacteria bacterium]|nr:nucleoporin [Alphaproteobacteria bacterium]